MKLCCVCKRPLPVSLGQGATLFGWAACSVHAEAMKRGTWAILTCPVCHAAIALGQDAGVIDQLALVLFVEGHYKRCGAMHLNTSVLAGIERTEPKPIMPDPVAARVFAGVRK